MDGALHRLNGGGGWFKDAEPAGVGDRHNGGLIGVTLGYNFQTNSPWVLGLEGDLGYFSHKDHRYLGTARVRIGFATGNLLPYFTCGLAVMDDAENLDPSETTNGGGRVGTTIGAGLEYAIMQNISVKGEYLYVNTDQSKNGPYGSLVRAGLNWRF